MIFKKNKVLLSLFGIFLFLSFQKITNQNHENWGFFAHREINKMAVFTLPPEMIIFYKRHIEYLADHAVDPDKRRYASPHEEFRHYLDLDVYGKPPFDNLPRNWTNALMAYSEIFAVSGKDTFLLVPRQVSDTSEVSDTFIPSDFDSLKLSEKLSRDSKEVLISTDTFRSFFIQNIVRNYYEEHWAIDCDSIAKLTGFEIENLNCDTAFAVDKLSKHGILPWHLVRMQRNLTEAFLEKDIDKILRFSADFGHYIADAHVPLHTTENYNGQLTGQNGIHAFWETRLPQLFYDDYDLWVGKSQYIENPTEYFWDIVLESHSYVDSVLLIEKDLRETLPSDMLTCYEERYGQMQQTQCREFSKIYHDRMNGMVESRLRDAILAVGSAWYSAWWDAGQPDLREISKKSASVALEQDSVELERKFRFGNIFGRKH